MPPVRVSGQFLSLTGAFRPESARPEASASASPAGGRQPEAAVAFPDIQISVPKRLLRSAVKRNTVKRVLREAWRAACEQPSSVMTGEENASGSGSGIAASSSGLTASPLASPDRIWRFSLKAHPGGSLLAKSQHARAQMRLAARKAAARAAALEAVAASARTRHEAAQVETSATDRRAAPASASPARQVESQLLLAQGFARHKRTLRAEADALLADALGKLARPSRERGRQASS